MYLGSDKFVPLKNLNEYNDLTFTVCVIISLNNFITLNSIWVILIPIMHYWRFFLFVCLVNDSKIKSIQLLE